MERGEHPNNLPPEQWLTLREHQLARSLVDHPRNSVECSTRPISEQAPFLSHGTSDSRFRGSVSVPNTSMLQSFGQLPQGVHSSRQVTSNAPSHALSDRSAWSHLLSLDSSLGNYSSVTSNQPQVASYRHPLFNMGNLDRPISDHSPVGHPLDLGSDNPSLSSMEAPLSQHSTPYNTAVSNTNFHQRSVASGHQTASQHLNQLINLSRDAGNFSRVPSSTANQPVEMLEQGGYSPVSPPSHDTGTPPTSLNSGHLPELLKRDALSSVSFSNSTENSINLIPDKPMDLFLKIPLSNQFMNTNVSGTVKDPHSFPSPLDMPLDMTKAFPPKEEAQNMSISKKNCHLPSNTSGNALAEDPGMDFELNTKSSLSGVKASSVQNLEKPCLDTSSISNFQSPADRQLKPVVRSTPKKSNFYGRDASLFSFSSEPLSQSQPQTIDNSNSAKPPYADTLSGSNVNPVSNSSSCGQIGVSDKPIIIDPPLSSFEDVTSVHASISLDCDSSTSNFADSFIEASTRDCDTTSTSVPEALKPDSVQPPVVTTISSSTDGERTPRIMEMPRCTVDLTKTENLVVEQQKATDDVMEASYHEKSSDAGGTPTVSSILALGENNDSVMPHHEGSKEDLEMETASDNMIPATAILPAVVKPAAKRRKRKGSGFQTRQRKRAKKLPVIVPMPPQAVEVGVGVVDPALVLPENQVVVPPKRKRRGRKKAQVSEAGDEGDGGEDAAPRRSSSRKSKANAMRLIELQADSSYGYTSQIVNEEPSAPQPPPLPAPIPAPSPKKKKRMTRAKKFVGVKDEDNILSEDSLSDDATEDEKDAEYAPDEEEEFQAELSPVEEDKDKNVRGRRTGGLKISIKLGTENLAQIVSGIRKRSPHKKRKDPIKKSGKGKFKSQAIIEDDDDSDDPSKGQEALLAPDSANQSKEPTDVLPATHEAEKPVTEDKEVSLLDKYFSAANAVNKQISSDKPLKKAVKMKKKPPGKSSKLPKSIKIKSVTQKADAYPGKATKNQKALAEKSALKAESAAQANKGVESSNGNVSGDVPKFVCGYCPKRYHNKDELMAHMEAHMAEMESKAENNNAKEVKKPSVGPVSKKLKIQSIPEKLDNKTPQGTNKTEKKANLSPENKCGECGQTFPSKSALLEHMSTHTVDKPFECNLCHKCFKDRDFLSAHRKTHNEEGLVRCPICSKGFIHEPDLVRHIQTHPKRSTPVVPLKRKIITPPQQTVVKTLKASTSEQSSEPVRTKPTSFASALSGHDEGPLHKIAKNPTIVLKRGDVSTALSNVDSSGKSSKPAASQSPSQKSAKQLESGDTKQTHSIVTKQENNANKESAKKTDSKVDNKSKTSSTADPEPGHCTCKECPECVTRFLQSFY